MATSRRDRAIQRRVRAAAAAERALAGDLARLIDRTASAAADAAGRGDRDLALSAPQRFERAIADAIVRRGVASAADVAEVVLQDVGRPRAKRRIDPNIEAVERAVTGWLRDLAARKARGITETSREQIGRALAEGYAAGENSRTIARRIRDKVGGAAAKARAETIARTETHSASERGAYVAAISTGLELDKEWGATADVRTRPTHAAADGQTVDAFEMFRVGDTLLRYPGDPDGSARETVNCRCVALYLPRAPGRPSSASAAAARSPVAEVIGEAEYDSLARDVAPVLSAPDTPESALSRDEAVAIRWYTTRGGPRLNEAFRTGRARSGEVEVAAAIARGLDRLPGYDGLVFRRIVMPPGEALAIWRPGQVWMDEAFLSASTARRRTRRGNVRFVIVSRTGRPIAALSDKPGQAEVLFQRGTRFEVTAVRRDGDKVEVELMEIGDAKRAEFSRAAREAFAAWDAIDADPNAPEYDEDLFERMTAGCNTPEFIARHAKR